MTAVPQGSTAVMARRVEAPDSLDLFPTPPWATRALVEEIIGAESLHGRVVWEPAAGLGTMSEVREAYCDHVFASDVHDYGRGHEIGSFVGAGPDVISIPGGVKAHLVITNPPFNLALEFAHRALEEAVEGVALLVRSVWSEGGARYDKLFAKTPPTIIAQFCDRVPMVKGRWDPKASTATAYSWYVWHLSNPAYPPGRTVFRWIKPGARQRYSRPDDVARFAGERP